MRPRHLMSLAGCLLTVLAVGCSGESPVQPEQSSSPALSVQSTRLTAPELLADPLLHDMLGALSDERSASRITKAVNSTYESLVQDDIRTARRHLDGAYRALDQYGGSDVGDEDVVHLDASERFLDEVEAMIDLGD